MKKIIISFVAILMLVPFVTFAASSIVATVSASKSSLKTGDTTVISVSITNIDQSSQGVAAFEGVLEYDKSVFESVSSSSFENKNGWTVLGFDATTGHFTLVNSGWVKIDQEMFAVTLKAKANAVVGSTSVTFKDLKTSDATNDIVLSNKSISLNITSAVSNNNVNNNVIINNNNNTVDNNVTNEIGNNITNNVFNNSNNNNNNNKITTYNSANNNIPDAGLEDFTFIAFIIAVISSIVYYVMYKRVK